VDLNGDGHLDILSGSYAVTRGKESAGYFHVLLGTAKGMFGTAAVVNGTDKRPLIISGKAPENYCTRPTAVDLNGDGKLDIVTGNFTGKFALFLGSGGGKFSPSHTWLLDPKGKRLRVDGKSDPVFVDWDGDGDLDLISGSNSGDVHLFLNGGSKTDPKFGRSAKLHSFETSEDVEAETVQLGKAHLTRPQGNARICVGDVNGDGKPDLLIGDHETHNAPAEGLTEEECREKLVAWTERNADLLSFMATAAKAERQGTGGAESARARIESIQRALRMHRAEYGRIVRTEGAGGVWVLLRK